MNRRPALVPFGPTLVAVALMVAACGAAPGGEPGPEAPAATPGTRMDTLTPEVAAVAATLQERLAEAGFSTSPSMVDYRPGEPAELQFVPRAVYRVALADPSAGWLLIYDLSSPDGALQAGRSFAGYLRSGVGQTNYPRDAQFALNQLGGALVFTWWSRERTSDPDGALASFEVIRGVGQSIDVVR